MSGSKEAKFLNLVKRVQACQKCPRMKESARVLGPGCGPLDAPLVFIGEAPGRLGADGSHIPFHGDKAGHNFEGFIEQVGINRYQVFVTNAVLCNPKDEAGNNSTPTPGEIANCAPFLREQIEILDPEIAVTLGAVALKSCALVAPHALTLKDAVRTSNAWNGKKLIPIYHPGQRALLHRSFANQLADYQFIAETLRRKAGKKKQTSKRQRARTTKIAEVAHRLLDKSPKGLSYFALHKLLFMAEVEHMDTVGERLTNAYVVRQKDGPYCVDLHIAKLVHMIPGLIVERKDGQVRLRLSPQLSLEAIPAVTSLLKTELASIDNVVCRYGSKTDTELKRVSYLSTPMRTLLRKEKQLRLNLFNAAVLPYQGKE